MWSSIFAYFDVSPLNLLILPILRRFFFQQSQWIFANWSLLKLEIKKSGEGLFVVAAVFVVVVVVVG